MMKDLVQLIISYGASDIHVSAGRKPIVRVNGELVEITTLAPLSQQDVVGILVECVGQEKAKAVVEKNELDFSYVSGTMRLRGAAFVQSGNIAIAFRALERVRTLAELGLPVQLQNFATARQGFFLVVGPVGQGKSTTMAAMIEHINQTRKEHIVTIENPIEYVFTPALSVIDQREVGTDTDSFESALSAMFRQDANVIMVGEMRNPETISTAVTAAETGHLVFSTLHTNTAAQTIDRIIDSFPANQQNQIRSQVSNSLLGIFSQRLVPSLQGGRVAAFELLINNPAVSNLIREGRVHEIDTVIETHHQDGMIDMNHSLLELVRQGSITMDDAIRYSTNPQAMKTLV
jgi:twitching motility protein PilT